MDKGLRLFIIFATIIITIYLLSFLIPTDVSCPGKNPFDTCSITKGSLDVVKRLLVGLSDEEADVLIANLLDSNSALKNHIDKNSITIEYINGPRSYTISRGIRLNLNQGWSNVRHDFLFESGHTVYNYVYCPIKTKDYKLVCGYVWFVSEEVFKRYFVQTHLFAREFEQSNGRLALDPTYDEDNLAARLEGYTEADPYVRLIIDMLEE